MIMVVFPLMLAAKNNYNPKIISTLVDLGANVNARDFTGFTPLMYAAMFNGSRIIEALIKEGADVNAVNAFNNTAFDCMKMGEYFSDSKGYKLLEKLTKK